MAEVDVHLLAHLYGAIDDEELLLLLGDNAGGARNPNPVYPYWEYEKFDLDVMNDSECLAEFRFKKADTLRVFQAMGFPHVIHTPNRLVIPWGHP